MQKIIVLIPLLALTFLTSCNNSNPKPKPVDHNSEYKTKTHYNDSYLDSTGIVTWENHHIVNDEGIKYIREKSEWVEKSYKDTYEYNGDDLLKEEKYIGGEIMTREINTYNSHHDITRNEKYNLTRGETDPAYTDYEYTYDTSGRILTKKESRCDTPSKHRINFISETTNTYDSRGRLKNVEISYFGGEEDPLQLTEIRTTTYTYKDAFKNYVTMCDEIKSPNGDLLEKANITCELDERGNQIDSYKEYYDYERSEHTYTETMTSYDENNYETSHHVYDLLVTTYDYPIIESYSITYHNHNYAQVDLETTTTYEVGKQTTKFKKYTYDDKDRLISLDDCASISGTKHQHYIYGYDD